MYTDVHSATGHTPAYLNYGRELQLSSLLDVEDGVSLETTIPKDWADKVYKLKDIYLLIRSNHEDAYNFAVKSSSVGIFISRPCNR
jgi:hypothetical protein